MRWLSILIVLFAVHILESAETQPVVQPVCTKLDTKNPRVDVFFINLDRSQDRRQYMEHQMKFYGYNQIHRIKAVTVKDVVVPQEVSRSQDCVSASNITTSFITHAAMFNPNTKKNNSIDTLNAPYKLMVKTLCGRPKNTRRELIVTISHLLALHTAVHMKSNSPYALILEYDMHIGFDIDFHALAESGPKGFGILQLVTSNDYDVRYLWDRYRKNKETLWTRREDKHDYWCAGAYLVNKTMLRPLLDGIVQDLDNGWRGLNIIAGFGGMTPRGVRETCTPSHCCPRVGKEWLPEYPTPCVKAPRGYQSDHYLFSIALGNSYMIGLPLITTGNQYSFTYTTLSCSIPHTLHYLHHTTLSYPTLLYTTHTSS